MQQKETKLQNFYLFLFLCILGYSFSLAYHYVDDFLYSIFMDRDLWRAHHFLPESLCCGPEFSDGAQTPGGLYTIFLRFLLLFSEDVKNIHLFQIALQILATILCIYSVAKQNSYFSALAAASIIFVNPIIINEHSRFYNPSFALSFALLAISFHQIYLRKKQTHYFLLSSFFLILASQTHISFLYLSLAIILIEICMKRTAMMKYFAVLHLLLFSPVLFSQSFCQLEDLFSSYQSLSGKHFGFSHAVDRILRISFGYRFFANLYQQIISLLPLLIVFFSIIYYSHQKSIKMLLKEKLFIYFSIYILLVSLVLLLGIQVLYRRIFFLIPIYYLVLSSSIYLLTQNISQKKYFKLLITILVCIVSFLHLIQWKQARTNYNFHTNLIKDVTELKREFPELELQSIATITKDKKGKYIISVNYDHSTFFNANSFITKKEKFQLAKEPKYCAIASLRMNKKINDLDSIYEIEPSLKDFPYLFEKKAASFHFFFFKPLSGNCLRSFNNPYTISSIEKNYRKKLKSSKKLIIERNSNYIDIAAKVLSPRELIFFLRLQQSEKHTIFSLHSNDLQGFKGTIYHRFQTAELSIQQGTDTQKITIPDLNIRGWNALISPFYFPKIDKIQGETSISLKLINYRNLLLKDASEKLLLENVKISL